MVAATPFPVVSTRSVTGWSLTACWLVKARRDRARMWDDSCSALAASWRSRSRLSGTAGRTSSTVSWPLVMVPVLSKAPVLAAASFSRTLPVLTTIPFREARLIPETMATGAARIRGHGEATTRTSANRRGSLEIHQATSEIKTAMMVKGTAYRSARRTKWAGVLSASLTSLTSCWY